MIGAQPAVAECVVSVGYQSPTASRRRRFAGFSGTTIKAMATAFINVPTSSHSMCIFCNGKFHSAALVRSGAVLNNWDKTAVLCLCWWMCVR